MATYLYRAFDTEGQVVEGEIQAASRQDLLQTLRRRELSPLQIDERAAVRTRLKLPTRARGASSFELLTMTQALATLTAAGLPLAQALDVVREQAGEGELRDLVDGLRADLAGGLPLSDALGRVPDRFPSYYQGIVRAGEMTGEIDAALGRVAALMERRADLRARLRSALTYPAILLTVMAISIAVLLGFVIPRFRVVFEDLGAALPLPTRMLLGISSLVSSFWWLAALAIAGGVLAYRWRMQTLDGRLARDRLLMSLPATGPLLRDLALAGYSSTLGALLRTGVPVLTAMRASREATGNAYLRQVLEIIEGRVSDGKPLATALRAYPELFPVAFTALVGTGEESGRLPELLSGAGEHFTRDADVRVRRFVTWMEPAITIGLGIIVGFVVISMLLPIFEMSDLVR
jgi:general secretion pathway protein F